MLCLSYINKKSRYNIQLYIHDKTKVTFIRHGTYPTLPIPPTRANTPRERRRTFDHPRACIAKAVRTIVMLLLPSQVLPGQKQNERKPSAAPDCGLVECRELFQGVARLGTTSYGNPALVPHSFGRPGMGSN